jgi:Uma2 family endonuclease
MAEPTVEWTADAARTVEALVKRDLAHWIAVSPDLRRQFLDALQGVPPAARMSYDEFLVWADSRHAEWVDGEVILMSPVSKRHQAVLGFLYKLLDTFVEERGLGTVLTAPFQMKLQNGREPDLLFVSNDHLERLTRTYLDGPADLAVEIISPESAGRDRGEKFYEYAQGGVREYWLLDPLTPWAEFYRLERGHYRLAFAGQSGVYEADVLPGFWLEVGWLWQEPLPKMLDVLRMLGLV